MSYEADEMSDYEELVIKILNIARKHGFTEHDLTRFDEYEILECLGAQLLNGSRYTAYQTAVIRNADRLIQQFICAMPTASIVLSEELLNSMERNLVRYQQAVKDQPVMGEDAP